VRRGLGQQKNIINNHLNYSHSMSSSHRVLSSDTETFVAQLTAGPQDDAGVGVGRM